MHHCLSRSVVKPFDDQKCLFCRNEEGMGHLHECMTEARDLALKQAFLDCSESLALYNIRYERALDASAGDTTHLVGLNILTTVLKILMRPVTIRLL